MKGQDPLAGVWYSGVGSKLELKVNGSRLEGFFQSTEAPGGKYPLVGSVDPDASQPNRALAFSVSWIDADRPNKFRRVSSYTGQYHQNSNREDVINTIFLLSDETRPRQQYVSTYVGYDNFERIRPSAEQIKKEKRRRSA
jgi:Avidin family